MADTSSVSKTPEPITTGASSTSPPSPRGKLGAREVVALVAITVAEKDQYVPFVSTITAPVKIAVDVGILVTGLAFITSGIGKKIFGSRHSKTNIGWGASLVGKSILAIIRNAISAVPFAGNAVVFAMDKIASKIFNYKPTNTYDPAVRGLLDENTGGKPFGA
jgi:hypothetical protein